MNVTAKQNKQYHPERQAAVEKYNSTFAKWYQMTCDPKLTEEQFFAVDAELNEARAELVKMENEYPTYQENKKAEQLRFKRNIGLAA